MKLARIFLALLVLTAAGVAWAAQTAPTTAPEAPAVSNAPAENGTAIEAPAQDGVLPLEIDGLFIEPSETGACCRAECLENKTACLDACGGDIACRSNCADEYWACLTNC
jgi:hypothetical protein